MSGYVLDLRKIVGHRTIMQVGATTAVEDPEGRLLLQLRTDNHTWGLPGGSVEIDEVVEDAARRELLEETGLTALELELLGIFSGPELHYVYPNGDEVSNVDHVYLVKRYTGTLIEQNEESQALRFFPANGLPANLNPMNLPPIQAWLNRKENGK